MTTVIYEDIVVQHVQCQPCNHFYIPPGHCNHFYKPPGHCFSKPLSQNIFNFKGFNQILTPLLNQTERFRYFVLILLNTVFTFLDVSTGKTNWVTKFEYRIEYYPLNKLNPTDFFGFFLAFNFCRFCVIIRFFHPRHNSQWPPTSKDFYPRFYPLYFLSYLYSLERASISLFNVECQTRNYWYHFYKVFGMTLSLTGVWTHDLPHSKPALYH